VKAMLPVDPPPEPARFQERCRARGNRWLAEHAPTPNERLPSYWREFLPDLCEGFHHRCGYLAMLDLDGTVDHFLSTEFHRDRAYEWTNYRYATGWLNSSKQTLDEEVLDPFEVREEWFEIDVASLHLRLTPAVPARMLPRARHTIERLGLRYGPRVMQKRQFYLGRYQAGEFSLVHLDRVAPLIATAVRRQRLLDHLAVNPPVSAAEVATVCETDLVRARQLVRIWRLAGHLFSQGRGRGVRYLRY